MFSALFPFFRPKSLSSGEISQLVSTAEHLGCELHLPEDAKSVRLWHISAPDWQLCFDRSHPGLRGGGQVPSQLRLTCARLALKGGQLWVGPRGIYQEARKYYKDHNDTDLSAKSEDRASGLLDLSRFHRESQPVQPGDANFGGLFDVFTRGESFWERFLSTPVQALLAAWPYNSKAQAQGPVASPTLNTGMLPILGIGERGLVVTVLVDRAKSLEAASCAIILAQELSKLLRSRG